MALSCTLIDSWFEEAEFKRERAAWEAQGLRHYRFVITSVISSSPDHFTAEITVFPDREPEVVIPSDEPGWEPYYGETIDEFYAFIADDIAGSNDVNTWREVRYNTRYHYPEYYASGFKYPMIGGTTKIKITEFESLE
jgi:hypothetical protein